MIAKYSTGNGFAGSLKYDLRAGKDAVPEQIRVLDASGVRVDFDDGCHMIIDTSKVSWDFRHRVMTYKGVMPIRKPVYHFSLSYHPNDNVTDEQMVEDAKEFLDKLGFGETQYVMIAHTDKEHHHLHIISNIINKKGKRISTERLTDRMHEIAAEITKDRGYTWGEKANKKTIENAHKPREKVRYIIEKIIKDAIIESISFEQLQDELIKKGVSCRVKEATDGKRGGISFSYSYKGVEHKFSGSSVDRSLSFANIKKMFEFNKNSLLYIVHSRTDASVYSLDPNYSYKDMEPLRQALVDRGYMVAGIQGKDEFDREIELLKKDKADFRMGKINRWNHNISFNKETIVGNPAMTEPAFARTAPTPAPQPRVKTVQALAKLKNVPSADKQSTKAAINKSELIDNDENKKISIKI